MKEYTGRVCDYCSEKEPFQKMMTMKETPCGGCENKITICHKCMRFGIEHRQVYKCVNCRRDIKLKEIGI